MGTNNLDLLMTNEEYQRFSWGYHSITGYMRYDGDELKIMMVVNNTGLKCYSGEELNEIEASMREHFHNQGVDRIEVLFVVYSNNIARDQEICDNVQCWLADIREKRILLDRRNISDFTSLYERVEKAAFVESEYENKKIIPWVTIAIIITNIVVFGYMESIGSTTDDYFMLMHGASFWKWEIEYNEYYRLFTCMFLHFGVGHLMNNMFTLYIIGSQAERIFGWGKYTIIYVGTGLLSGVSSTIIHMLIGDPVISAGASGAIYGVMGAVVAAIWLNRRKNSIFQPRLLIVIVLLCYSGFTGTQVDNAAHIGGFISGIIIGGIMLFSGKRKRESLNKVS